MNYAFKELALMVMVSYFGRFLLSMSELVMIKFENLGDFDPHDHVNYTEARIQELKALLDQLVSNISPFVSSGNNTTVISLISHLHLLIGCFFLMIYVFALKEIMTLLTLSRP
jgi:hypothetical protein